MPGYRLRSAPAGDTAHIARAIALSSGCYARIGWREQQDEFPGLALAQIGARMYGLDIQPFTWRNGLILGTDQVLGVMVAYRIDDGDQSVEPEVAEDDQDLYYLVKMEAADSWYTGGMTVFEPWRNRGLGSRFLQAAREQAVEQGYPRLSLIAFEQNEGPVRLYLRNGFEIIERRRMMSHPIIEYDRGALLRVSPVA